ncbi:hypothetical protein NFI96_000778 [Prochilodus magdalenae]|nr:hypothetical protein NFI96_000778 [Prochilodus magdalenae]
MNSESPSNTHQIPGLDGLFNVSLSYRKDADISLPYGWVIPLKRELRHFVPPVKRRMVCWIVSNYNSEHRRVHYYTELQKYIRVHVYGDYFERHLSKEKYEEVLASCKFYLSFENSVHKDYITEKLFNALALGAVPVVFGPSRQNYERFVPSDAFIHVEDFPSVRALAKHLLFLHKNEEQYHRYFRWRRHFEAKTSSFPEEHACHACEYIRRNKEYQDCGLYYSGLFLHMCRVRPKRNQKKANLHCPKKISKKTLTVSAELLLFNPRGESGLVKTLDMQTCAIPEMDRKERREEKRDQPLSLSQQLHVLPVCHSPVAPVFFPQSKNMQSGELEMLNCPVGASVYQHWPPVRAVSELMDNGHGTLPTGRCPQDTVSWLVYYSQSCSDTEVFIDSSSTAVSNPLKPAPLGYMRGYASPR